MLPIVFKRYVKKACRGACSRLSLMIEKAFFAFLHFLHIMETHVTETYETLFQISQVLFFALPHSILIGTRERD